MPYFDGRLVIESNTPQLLLIPVYLSFSIRNHHAKVVGYNFSVYAIKNSF